MPQSKGPFYMTTAIAYTSGKPHIGNTYEIVLADSIARFRRQEGYDVFFQTGTDEHGQKIELKAEEAGITPKEQMITMRSRFRRFLRNFMIRETFIRVHMKACTVLHVSLSGQRASLLMESVLIVDVKLSQLRKKLISSR